MKQRYRLQVAGFSLFELLISLALLTLMLAFLITTGTQAAKMWSESEEQEEMMAEGRALLQMMCHDLRSATSSSPIEIRESSNIFFLMRTPSDDLVTIGYFLDPSKKSYCYRFFANAHETLATMNNKNLTQLESCAAPGEAHSELIATHLLSWKIIPFYKNKNQMTLLEINLALGKTTPSYFLSTVVSIQNSSIL